jgi:ABC-type uncharacterized transport system permease subunit
MKGLINHWKNTKFTITQRHESSSWRVTWTTGVSLIIGFALIWLVFLVTAKDPNAAILRIFTGSLGSIKNLELTIIKSLPLIVVGLGLSVAFQGKFWNIGAEGQILMGATASVAVSLMLGPNIPGFLHLPLMMIAGLLAGALTGLIPATLKTMGVNEVITTLMLNYIAMAIVDFLRGGPMKGASQQGRLRSDLIPEPAHWAYFPGTKIAIIYVILVVVLVVAIYLLFHYSKKGLEIRILGENQEAARYAGIPYGKTMILMMLFSGGVAGLAGVSEVATKHFLLDEPLNISAGYGFTAIIVAWLGRLNPLGIIFSGFFLPCCYPVVRNSSSWGYPRLR